MIEYQTNDLARQTRFFPEFALVQGLRPEADYIAALHRQMEQQMRITSAWDRGKCAGTLGYFLARAIHEGPEIMRKLGLPFDKCIVRSNIYVHPHFQGRGLSMALYRMSTQDAIARGYTIGVGFAYANSEIASWGHHIPGTQKTDVTDKNGHTVIVSDLKAMLEAIPEKRIVAPRRKRPDVGAYTGGE